ncbi:hypothetical protein [Sphingobacterium bovistauri]|uniref:Outer membrane protein beta-barrel domain-containing protein n=1 Tax=Sphingobacterium bovistauri TaxID=2781959 RepID=A0ABS7Z1Q4_9SPHI|nr:hypothetical protein [Sphingobacterium bovistauri]MCA5003527.1 hypothetical protein [Sphingobacterium bovistauri]
MKYKFTPILAITLAFNSFALANEPIEKKPPVKGSQSLKNWFFSANVGAQVFIGDHDKQESVGKRISPNFGISAGKWIEETNFGVRVNIDGGQIKGLTQTAGLAIDPQKGHVIGAPHFLYKQKFNFIHAHADVLFHWSNDAYGVDLNRLYNLIPYAGFGVISALDYQKKAKPTMNVGVIQTLRLNDNWDLNLDVKGNVVGDAFDGEIGGNNFEGRTAVSIGVNYTFR